MKPIKTDKFLDKYKEFENILRENGDFLNDTSVPSYEEYLKNNTKTSEAEKLRYLRTMRNLAVHVPELKDFVCTCDEHISFLEEHIGKLESVKGIVKDKYSTIAKSGALTPNDTLLIASQNLISKGVSILPIVDVNVNRVWYIVDRDVLSFINSGERTSAKLSKFTKQLDEFINPLENGVLYMSPLNKVPEHTKPIPVIKSNKIVGFI